MKKTLILTLLLIMTLPLVALSSTTPDTLKVAQVFAGINISECDGYIEFNGVSDSGSTWINGNFDLTKVGTKYQITYLEINNTVLTDVSAGDDPVYKLPEYDGEARDVNINLNCFEHSNETVAYSHYYDKLLEAGEPVKMTLRAGSRYTFIPHDLPNNVEADCFRLYFDEGNYQNYDISRHGFSIYVDPTIITEYDIVDVCENISHDNGTIDPFSSNNQSKDSTLNVSFPIGVNEVIFNDHGHWWVDKQNLNGTTDEIIPVETYIINPEEKNVQLNINGLDDLTVIAYAISESNSMEEIDLVFDQNCTGDYFCASVPSGYKKIMIAVIGTTNVKYNFYISFSKWSY